ncbi:MAG: response regulator [Spirochaetia bacterium]|jgi:two-component SAPR family response regulator|nr:response regulator [Spirochaetia bacterium]
MDKTVKILLIEDEVITAMSLIMDVIPDLIIADVSLSEGESGIDLAAKITEKNSIPVIITSGYEPEELNEKMGILDNAHFIRKPVMVSRLIKLIESL